MSRPLTAEGSLLLASARVTTDDSIRRLMAAALARGVNWGAVVDRSVAEGTAGLLLARLTEEPSTARRVPAATLARLATIQRATWARNAVLTDRWAEIMRLLAEARVAVITHKGMALIHTVYPDTGLRPMADIDLLIRPSDLSTAKRVLRSAGYRTPEERLEAEASFRAYLQLVREGTVIDLHWELAHYTRFQGILRVDPEGIWARAYVFGAADVRGLTLSPEDTLLHLALHLTVGSEFGRLIWFSDIEAVLRHYAGVLEWDRTLAEARRWGVRRILHYVLRIATGAFGAPVPETVLKDLGDGRLVVALTSTCVDTQRPPSLSGTPPATRALLATALLMDRWRDVWRVLWRSLFPSPVWVGFHYGVTSRWRIALHRAFHPLRVCYLALRHLR